MDFNQLKLQPEKNQIDLVDITGFLPPSSQNSQQLLPLGRGRLLQTDPTRDIPTLNAPKDDWFYQEQQPEPSLELPTSQSSLIERKSDEPLSLSFIRNYKNVPDEELVDELWMSATELLNQLKQDRKYRATIGNINVLHQSCQRAYDEVLARGLKLPDELTELLETLSIYGHGFTDVFLTKSISKDSYLPLPLDEEQTEEYLEILETDKPEEQSVLDMAGIPQIPEQSFAELTEVPWSYKPDVREDVALETPEEIEFYKNGQLLGSQALPSGGAGKKGKPMRRSGAIPAILPILGKIAPWAISAGVSLVSAKVASDATKKQKEAEKQLEEQSLQSQSVSDQITQQPDVIPFAPTSPENQEVINTFEPSGLSPQQIDSAIEMNNLIQDKNKSDLESRMNNLNLYNKFITQAPQNKTVAPTGLLTDSGLSSVTPFENWRANNIQLDHDAQMTSANYASAARNHALLNSADRQIKDILGSGTENVSNTDMGRSAVSMIHDTLGLKLADSASAFAQQVSQADINSRQQLEELAISALDRTNSISAGQLTAMLQDEAIKNTLPLSGDTLKGIMDELRSANDDKTTSIYNLIQLLTSLTTLQLSPSITEEQSKWIENMINQVQKKIDSI